MKIGITGGIGSGKSFVCSRLAARGIVVYDCDSAAKRLMLSSPALKKALTSLIGNETYVNGHLNKAKVAEYLLASEDNAQAINDIVHPAVADDYINSGAEWMECAILYESGFNLLVDKVVAVTAPYDIRLQRIVSRDGISEAKAKEWIAKQMPQEEVARKADYIINNDGKQDIDEQIDQLINKLK